MSNQGAAREFNNPHYKHKTGNKPGSYNKRKSYQNEQKSEEDKARQATSSDSYEASGGQASGFDNKSNKFWNKNNYENRPLRNQGLPFSSKGNQGKPQARVFKMSPSNSNAEAECDQKLSGSDDYKERIRKRMNTFQSAETPLVKVDQDQNKSDKSSNSTSASMLHTVETKSGPFECSINLSDPKESSQSGLDNAEQSIKRGESCVTEVEGDLFSAPENVSLAHCVGADLRMGSGIAVHFRDKFQSIGKLFDQRVEPGGVATIPFEKRHVFYLITKQASTDKPTNDTMKKSLLALREKCKQLNVTQLAMPQIGCGMDGLFWNDVKQMLEEIFANGFAITIYKLDKDFVSKPETMFKSCVVNKNLMLKDIEPGTGLLYIGYADVFMSEEMKSINERYSFLPRLKSLPLQLGRTFSIESKGELIYGLISKESRESRLSYEHLEAAIDHLREHNEKDRYEYFGIQAFKEKNDPHVMEKIDTLFRNSCIDAEFWICWPPSMVHMRPSNSKQNDKGMQVQESQYPFTGNQQSSSSHSSNSATKSKDRKNNRDSPKAQNKPDNAHRNSFGQDQAVKEVEEKMNAQSLGDESKSGINYSEAADDTGMRWDDDDNQFPQMPDIPLDSSHNTEDHWECESKAYEEDERRKSNEKKVAKQLNEEKKKQERKSFEKPKSCVTECKGDLFEVEDTMCLAHCVGADFKMGAGIAVIFRREFGKVGELLDQGVTQGGVAYIRHEKRFIFYLVTKRESTGKPTLETLERSLHELHRKCKELNVTELAMPRIGCGLDRLEWSDVKKMLEDIFADGFSIKIYNLEKDYQETKQSMPKTTIRNEVLHLKDIQLGTGLLYIGTVEPFESEEMKSLDEKYRFLQRLEKTRPKLGTVVRTQASYPREIVYGLICKQSPNDRLSFVHLQTALKQLRKLAKTDCYKYYGIQAFKDKHDANVMGKIETLLRYSYIEAEAWICFPPSLKHLMPASSLPIYNPNTSGNGRNLWSEPDNKRMVTLVRDLQRSQEFTYRKLMVLDDIGEKISSPDGLNAKVTQNTNRMDEFDRGMDALSSKIDDIIQEYNSFYESYETLERRVKVLETEQETEQETKQELEKRVQLLEQRLQLPPHSAAQDYYFNMSGGYSSARFPHGPGPCIQGLAGRHVYQPNPADYYSENMQLVHSGYPPPQFFATEQLPHEKEALRRAVQCFAKKNHCHTKVIDEIIYMSRYDDQAYSPIYSHGDLNYFENSET